MTDYYRENYDHRLNIYLKWNTNSHHKRMKFENITKMIEFESLTIIKQWVV